MPRSSRHKSSKHSGREVREYSDSERDSGLKEKKGRNDSSSSRHLKDSASGEKRKLDSKSVDIIKDLFGSSSNVNVEAFVSGCRVSSSSKKRKEKVDDDRWTGGVNNVKHEISKTETKKEKEKEGRWLGDSKRSSKREGGSGLVFGFDDEEGKKSGGKVDSSKHHRSERKERGDKERAEKEKSDRERGEKEGGSERERKGSRSERLVDIVTVSENVSIGGNNKKQGTSAEEHSRKHSVGITDCNIQEELCTPELERDLDRRVRRRRDDSGDADKHQDGVRGHVEKRLSSKEEISKSGKYKDDGLKDEKTRDRYQEDADKDNWHQDEKQKDNQPVRDYAGGRSDDNHLRNDKKELDALQKKSKLLGNEYDRELDRDREPERDSDRDQGKGCHRDRVLDHDHSHLVHDRECDRENDNRDHNTDRDRDRNLERAHDRDHEPDRDRDQRRRDRYRRNRDRDRIRDRDNDRGRGRDLDNDYGHGSYEDDKGSRYNDVRGRRRSPDGYDDYPAEKFRRVEHEDKERSLSRKPNADSVSGSSRRRTSPSAKSCTGADKYRDSLRNDIKNGDSLRDDTVPEALEKVSKYHSAEKRAKFDDNVGEFSERSPSTKASPAALKERSPSSTSYDRRFPSRNSRRWSLDVDESERSIGSNEIRNVTVPEDRNYRDYSVKKSMCEDYPLPESSFYHKSGQANISSHGPSPGPSGFRSGADSPSYVGSLGEDSRGHSGNRYRRSVDPHVGRGPGSAWKGIPKWPSPLPNGFIPFPPGPPGPHHGGFPPIISQFPPLFSVRPSLDMSHPGIPYHIAEGDRFPGHVRPIGWPNMVEGTIPPHFHGWDANNGGLRDDTSIYGPGHLGNAQSRDMNADMRKLNEDANMDVTSMSQRDAHLFKASTDEASSAEGNSRLYVESSCIDQGASIKKEASSGLSAMKELPTTPAKVSTDKTPESTSVDDNANSMHAYLAKLDISIDLADAELYNQWINLAVKGESKYNEDDVQFDLTEDKDVVESDITDLAVGVNFFPAVKDSIFQRAMDLYNTQSTDRRITALLDGEKLDNRLPIANDEVDTAVADCIEQEEKTHVVQEEFVPVTCDGKGREPVCMSSEGVLDGGPLQSFEPGLDVDVESQMPVLDVEIMEEGTSVALALEDIVKDRFQVESTCLDPIDSNTNGDITVRDGGKTGGNKPAPGEQLDVAVSDPLILSNAVKVCEAFISVSNESDSVVLSRIHHSPESTH